MSKQIKSCEKLSGALSFVTVSLLLLGIFLSFSGCGKVPIKADVRSGDAEPLTVMTYNVYVGGSVGKVIATENIAELPAAVSHLYNSILASDFPGRAQAIVKSIKPYQPHLIGLQEISLIRQQSPGDRITGGTVPAEEVVLDSLDIFMTALQMEGLNYQVASEVENIDVEMPMFTETGIVDVRLTDFDVILARSDVEITRSMSGNFTAVLNVDPLDLQIPRGYTAVDATVAGKTYRFVNTHLEAFTQEIRTAQIQELADILSDETLPIFVVGDFNTPAPEGAAYQLLLSEGYVDLWQTDVEGTGNTCCHEEDLRNAVGDYATRIDLIFARNLEPPASILTKTVGDDPSDRSDSGLWPSDHLGVVVQLW